ncbi:MAG: hypothetical protein LBH46_02980 [Rickettsiales bacterium]|jgi:uncharacterized protein YutD|nr:hypothetical protein [Rickettsiales bacterium]
MDFEDVLRTKEKQLEDSLNNLRDVVTLRIQQEEIKNKKKNENFAEVKNDLSEILNSFDEIITKFGNKQSNHPLEED